ncbi:MAG: ATP-binding cassette domain-containing protein [Kofleriaceae bacterium]|nr:ATP-binding cassette domain-containing protein [Kofleriaceae bacterium]MCB9574096.1 ATP-binding cassette domain-containing protein [Kofleriaceae bacterium]
MLALRDVVKTYGDRRVLDGVTLEVAAGARVALIGPSGCGKSTALRVLTGLVRADAGEAWLCDQALTPRTVAGLRRRLGYVIQDGGLFPHLTARDNVALPARHQGWARDRVDARIAELAALMRLPEPLLARHPVQLSGGQRQRVALMRALILDPEVLLLDEPLGALDPMVRAELQDELRALFARLGKTVLIVTHDLAEAAHLADEIVLMRDGRIAQRGPIGALADQPADDFVRRFVRAQRRLHLDDEGAGG